MKDKTQTVQRKKGDKKNKERGHYKTKKAKRKTS